MKSFYTLILLFFCICIIGQAQINPTSADTCSHLVIALGKVVNGVPVVVSFGYKAIDTSESKTITCIISFLKTDSGNIMVDSIHGRLDFFAAGDVAEWSIDKLDISQPELITSMHRCLDHNRNTTLWVNLDRILLANGLLLKNCNKKFTFK